MATSSAVARFTGRSLIAAADPASPAPNPANSTLASERFMASVICTVRIRPAAPTRAPPMIRALLSIANPAAAAASPENELSSEITTGMSAPPIGTTASTPTARATPATPQYPAGSAATPPQMAIAMSPAPSRPLTTCWPGNTRGRPGKTPWSFPKATKLPVRVTAPITSDARIDTMVSGAMSSRSASTTATAATIADAAPPNPLKAATICGIAVIWTRNANQPPSAAPTTRPAPTVAQLTMSSDTRVSTIAPSMPAEAIRLPSLAVRGPPSWRSPTMRPTAHAR